MDEDEEEERLKDSDAKLAYTSPNAPLHAYTEALIRLLNRLDAIESGGDRTVRERRREVVRGIEKEAEGVERWWRDVWRGWVARGKEVSEVEEKGEEMAKEVLDAEMKDEGPVEGEEISLTPAEDEGFSENEMEIEVETPSMEVTEPQPSVNPDISTTTNINDTTTAPIDVPSPSPTPIETDDESSSYATPVAVIDADESEPAPIEVDVAPTDGEATRIDAHPPSTTAADGIIAPLDVDSSASTSTSEPNGAAVTPTANDASTTTATSNDLPPTEDEYDWVDDTYSDYHSVAGDLDGDSSDETPVVAHSDSASIGDTDLRDMSSKKVRTRTRTGSKAKNLKEKEKRGRRRTRGVVGRELVNLKSPRLRPRSRSKAKSKSKSKESNRSRGRKGGEVSIPILG